MLSLTLMLVTVAAGLAIRFARLGLPPVVVKYGGSTLWALMVYWIVSTLLTSWSVPVVAVLAGAVATAVEFVKVYHSPGLDAFRLTLPGILLLGRVFSGWDIVAYWLAIVAGAVADQRIGGIRSGPEIPSHASIPKSAVLCTGLRYDTTPPNGSSGGTLGCCAGT
jgi:hypothetical protein